MRALELLFLAAPDEQAEVEPLVAGLRRAGHRAALVLDGEAALGRPTPDVLLVTEAADLELLLAFEAGSHSPQRIALLRQRDFDAATTALRAGADELLVAPTAAELVAALRPRPFDRPRVHTPRSNSETYLVGQDLPASGLRPVLDLLAFTTRLGLERAWRTRVATAAALAVDNARTHAYPGTEGPLELRAERSGERLVVTLVDRGVGFDIHTSTTGDTCRGLDLVRALAERVDLSSSAEGTTLRLEFELTPTRFDEQPPSLDELDHLDPATCRELRSLAADVDLPSFLVPTVGRLVAATPISADPAQCLTA